jgi:hypothetical protein
MTVENETYGSLPGNIGKFQKIGVDREYNIYIYIYIYDSISLKFSITEQMVWWRVEVNIISIFVILTSVILKIAIVLSSFVCIFIEVLLSSLFVFEL